MHRTRYRNKHTAADRYEKRVRVPPETQLRSGPSRGHIATAVALPMAHAQGEFRSETRPDGGAARGRACRAAGRGRAQTTDQAGVARASAQRTDERTHPHSTQERRESERCLKSCIVESEAQWVGANAPGRCEQIGREGLELSELFLKTTQQRLIDPSLVALETQPGDTLLKMLGKNLLLAICTDARIRRAHT